MYGTRHFESTVALSWPKVECPLKGISEPVKVYKVTGATAGAEALRRDHQMLQKNP